MNNQHRMNKMIVPNQIVRPGPTDVVPLLTARSTKSLGRPSGRISCKSAAKRPSAKKRQPYSHKNLLKSVSL